MKSFENQKENQDPIATENTQMGERGEKGMQKQLENHKGNIKFRCPSFERRNIDKALVRALSTLRKGVKAEIFEEYRLQNIERNKYNEIAMTLDNINSMIKKSNGKKDYAYIINWMISGQAQRIMFKTCLQKKKKIIAESESQRVKGKNQEVYLKTLEDYLNYINDL